MTSAYNVGTVLPAVPQGDIPSFSDLGVAPDLIACLAEAGIAQPFPIQALTIPDALDGRDVCGKAKTGSGKTLAFGLVIAERTSTAQKRRPQALVLVPTRELATQVSNALLPLVKARRLWLATVYGGVPMMKQVKALHDGVDVVIATPGRLIDLLDRKEMSLTDMRTVVIDEADQMADMGFLPQVERIMRQIPADRQHQTLLFSATLDGAVGTIVRRYMHDPVHREVESKTVTVDEMEHRFIGVHNTDKADVAAAICRGNARVLLFCRTKHGVDRLTSELQRREVNAKAIHGGHVQAKRERALKDFMKGKVPALVATNVAARGLHVEGIDVVVHYDPPDDYKSYLHRSGRTARAGESGMVVTLVQWDQRVEVKRLQRQVGLSQKIVEMYSTDERLRDLTAWIPPEDDPPARTGQKGGRRPGKLAADSPYRKLGGRRGRR